MSQNAQETLIGPGLFAAAAKSRAKPTLQLREDALHLPSLPETFCRELLLHLPSVGALRDRFGTSPIVDGDDGLADPQLFPAQTMVRFAVVGCVRIEGLDLEPPRRLPHHGAQVRRVVAWPGTHRHPGDQMRGVLAQNGQLRVASVALHATAARKEMAADVAALKPRGVQRGRPIGAEAALCGSLEDGVEQGREGPPFSSRCSAF